MLLDTVGGANCSGDGFVQDDFVSISDEACDEFALQFSGVGLPAQHADYVATLGKDVAEEGVKHEKKMRELFGEHGEDNLLKTYGSLRLCGPGHICSRCAEEIAETWLRGLNSLVIGQSGKKCNGTLRSLLDCSLGTWNSAGLCCENMHRYTNKFELCCNVFEDCDVFGVQETHDDGRADLLHLRNGMQNHAVFGSYISSAKGGVCIGIKRSFAERFSGIERFEIHKGRVLTITLYTELYRFTFVNIHLQGDDNDSCSKLTILKSIHRFCKERPGEYIWLFGDWNFVLESSDRQDINTGICVGKKCEVAEFWDEHFADFSEIYQQSHTRYPKFGTHSGTSARLDRIYFNAPLEADDLLEIRCSIVGGWSDNNPSDHLPIVATTTYKTSECSVPKIPQSVVESQLFAKLVNEILDQKVLTECCWGRLLEIKDVFFEAWGRYKDVSCSRCAGTSEERIFWALRALKASDCHDRHELFKSLDACPQLVCGGDASCGNPDGVLSSAQKMHIRGILRQALEQDPSHKAEELKNCRNMPEYETIRKKDSLAKKLAKYAKKHRKLGIEQVRDENGHVITDKDKASKFLGGYWGGKFAEKGIDENLANQFLGKFTNRFPATSWVINFFVFMLILGGAKKSAAGPDGVPYGAWNSSLRCAIALFSAYYVWIHVGILPPFFNVAYLWLLPKGEPEDNIYNPSDTRPLSGANADAKLLAMCAAFCLNTVVGKFVNSAQRGFIRGRIMLENVIEVETHSILEAGNADSNAALVFYDFAAAFPSIARAFIFLVFSAIGLPKHIIRALRALYDSNIHYIRGKRGLMFAFVALAGVRQGCPLSSTIFVIVTDCICNALIWRLGPGSLLRMYADDICISYRDFFLHAARIARTFDVIGQISCLYLNGKKCVIVPVGKLTIDFVRAWVKVNVTLWRDFKVCSCAKYLGFLIGPGAGNQDWVRVLDKIRQTSKFIRGLGLPKLFAFSLFQMFGVSQIQFVAQLRVPPKSIDGVDVSVVRDLIGGPGLWAPCCLFRNFKVVGFPVEIQSLKVVSRATMARSGLVALRSHQALACSLDSSIHCVSSYFIHPNKVWRDTCAVIEIQRAVKNITDSNFISKFYGGDLIACLQDRNVQSKLTCHYNRISFPFDDLSFWERQFSKWFSIERCSIFASRAVNIISFIRNKVPPCVIFTLIAAWSNGWATGCRFQARDTQCCIHEECQGEDSIEHYGECIAPWAVFCSQTGIHVEQNLENFLVVGSDESQSWVFLACHLYAVKRAADYGRRCSPCPTSVEVRNLIVGGYKVAACHSNGLASRYAALWNGHA